MIRKPSKLLLGILAVYLFLASWNAATRGPRGDEVQFANPALDLITRGTTGVTILSGFGAHPEVPPPADTHFTTYSYWAMPLSFVTLAAWFKVVGFGFFQMRAWPVLMGLLGLLSWYFVVRELTNSRAAALLAAGLIAVDHAFLDGVIRRVLLEERIDAASISLALVSDSEIHHVNREFLGHDCPTDVISFRLNESPERIESVVLHSGG